MLGPASIGSDRLRDFVAQGGLSVWFLDRAWLTRAFELMELYAEHFQLARRRGRLRHVNEARRARVRFQK